MAGERRRRVEALLASGQASLERARARSLLVDTMVGVVRRERPVAIGILAASLAFRLFALVVPLAYVLVAGFGFAGARASRPGSEDRLRELVVDSIAAASRSSERARWLALIFGGLATLLAAAGVVQVLRWVQVLAWRVRPAWARRSPWQASGLVAGVAVLAATSTLAERARAGARGLASEVGVLLATAAAQVVVTALLWLALSWAMRPVAVRWTTLVPGALLFAGGTQGFAPAAGPPSPRGAAPALRAARPRPSAGGRRGCGRPRTRR